MNILLPLGKLKRTLDSRYDDKPLQLTLVLGRPILFWLLDSLRFDEENDTVWVIVSARDEAIYNIFSALSAEYRTMKVTGRLRFVPLHYSTRGVTETLNIALKYMSPTDLVKKTLCVNGDMLFNPEICVVSRTVPSNSAACFLAYSSELLVDEQISYGENSRWSYCEVQEAEGESKWELNCCTDHVRGRCNIVRITDDSPTTAVMIGAYAFGSARLLELLTEKAMHAAGTAYNGQNLGFPNLFQVGIDSKDQNIFGVLMAGLSCTPLKCTEQLEHFINSTPSLNTSHVAKASTRYLFQMYGGVLNDRDEPRKHVVDVMRKLKRFGHHIIVSSSRGRGAAAVKELIDKLELFAICYDEIELHDDDRDYIVMVGSYVCDIRGDLHKALGVPGDSSLKLEAIPPRHFNHVSIVDGSVTKTSNVESLAGEAFYYENIPKQLQHLFPKYLSKNSDNNGNLSIEISKVEGITFSQLMVNRCVDEARLQCLLHAITELHSHTIHGVLHCTSKPVPVDGSINFYSNYAQKVHLRYQTHLELYTRIITSDTSSDAPSVLQRILTALNEYEVNQRADVRTYIHGDPVFSNCLHSPCGRVCFIDMNGRLGQEFTTSGDCSYDLAKILQSLHGYDYILLNVAMHDADIAILRRLRHSFRDHVARHYPKIRWKDLHLITASLFVSLIPLHDDFSHQLQFWQLGKSLLESWQLDGELTG